MDDHFDTQMPGHSLFLRIEALSSLFCVLAWLFSYPSKEQVQKIASKEFLIECKSLLREASIEDDGLCDVYARFENGLQNEGSIGSKSFRAEYTRLFIAPSPRISLQGARWVKNRVPLAKSKGEEFAVKQVYRQLGLKNQVGVKDSSDHLVTELDYMSYVTSAETQAWRGGDVANAREWRNLGCAFMEDHLAALALGVSAEVQRLSNNVMMLFCARLLHAVVTVDFYKTA